MPNRVWRGGLIDKDVPAANTELVRCVSPKESTNSVESLMSVEETKTALQGLAEALSSPLDRNDLGRLARMHSFCECLAAGDQPADAGPRETVHRLAAGLVAILEKLILDEAARPDDGLALIPQAVQMVQATFDGQAGDDSSMVARLQACIAGEDVSTPAIAETPPPAARLPEPAPCAEPAPTETPKAEAPPPVESATPAAPASLPIEAEAYVSEPLLIDLTETEHLVGFIEESREHMDGIETALLEVEQDPSDTGKINELFRPFHTIKGIAGFLNLRDVNRLTHEVETILDMGRKNELQITSGTTDRIFAAVDLLKLQISEIANFVASPSGEVCPQPDIVSMMAELRGIQRQNQPATAPPTQPQPKLGEILVANESATPDELEQALEVQAADPPPPRKVGEIMVDHGAVSHKQVDSALAQQATGKTVAAEQSLRVDIAKLDALVDAVGELVIAQTMVNLSDSVGGDPKLQRDVTQVTKIVRDVQETAMGMRMVPIGPTFQKMRRLVRDVSRKAGKQVELHISGEETELDKTVIQQISDPLVHMVRNSVDHGVESPEARRETGKPEVGNVYLDAYHQGDSIVIEICDDGAGLDRDKLIAKGIERGLVTPDTQLTDQQAFALILGAGFSTAKEVTDISGRGVGMDVVKRNIDQLRGKIEIQSELGQGTTFFIRLPLTLAIIDGMLVRVGEERLIIPTILIEQSLRPQPSQITTVQRRGEMLQVRGELCPLIQLGQLFGYSDRVDPCETLVVIAHTEGQKVGLVVDELIGQQQVVIKSLAEGFKHINGVSGAAILGDGRVGLILEPTGLTRLHSTCHTSVIASRSRAPATPPTVTPESTGFAADPEPEVVREQKKPQTCTDAADVAIAAATLT